MKDRGSGQTAEQEADWLQTGENTGMKLRTVLKVLAGIRKRIMAAFSGTPVCDRELPPGRNRAVRLE